MREIDPENSELCQKNQVVFPLVSCTFTNSNSVVQREIRTHILPATSDTPSKVRYFVKVIAKINYRGS